MDDKGYLLRLIREGEHQQQDFKYRVADACKLAKSVSAFANTDGGRLLIGNRLRLSMQVQRYLFFSKSQQIAGRKEFTIIVYAGAKILIF